MYIKQTHSTSSLLREQYTDDLPHLYTIRTDFQTAGRGQAGNSWESEDGKNLLFSTLLRYPTLQAAEQWRLSMLVAVAVREAIEKTIQNGLDRLKIKWPNDIYYGDKKLVGILIENTLVGGNIAYTIAGIGINVNQTEWRSDAPNPISIKQITGGECEIESLLGAFLEALQKWETISTPALSLEYMTHLYRYQEWHWFVEREVSTTPTAIANSMTGGFEAKIMDITCQGELVLQTRDGENKNYHFKQIRFIIQNL